MGSVSMIIWRFGLDWPKMRQKLDAIVVLQNQVLSPQNQIHCVSNSGKLIIIYNLVIQLVLGVVLGLVLGVVLNTVLESGVVLSLVIL